MAVMLGFALPVRAEKSFPPTTGWQAQWISVVGASKPNTWTCFRKRFSLSEKPKTVFAQIACDSKYWLWINGELVVFEGQLKRGPTPQDTYFDSVNIGQYLHEGENHVAVLVCHFGKHGYSHNSSGKAALLFEADFGEHKLLSDESWLARVHPAFGTTDPPLDNVRPPEANLRFDARHDLGDWQLSTYDDSSWGPAMSHGRPPTAPWNQLYQRPIPLWKDSGLIEYANSEELPEVSDGQPIVCKLPYNCHVTPYLKVSATAGQVIGIATDIKQLYGKLPLIETHRHEYVTRDGIQEFELPSWINGHEIHYAVPAGVKILALKYRETGYDTEFVGQFLCDDEKLNQLWEESRRTLYVTMRDTYMDCPDRERAQWWGDAVNEIGESFYVFETERAPLLAKKAIYELTRWQREDGTLYSPVPSGVRRPGLIYPLDGSWDQELPQQMLASISWYGFWTYYWYTGDQATIRDAYPAVSRYLKLWKLGEDGLVIHRPGGWDWTDWGQNIDTSVVENAWLYLALKGAVELARLTDNDQDIADYEATMARISQKFNSTFWQGHEYRSPGYQGATDDRAQAMAVVAGLATSEYYPSIAKVLKHEQHASPYLEKYVLEALLLMNEPELACERMKDRYDQMLADDQTTLWETFEEMVLPDFGSLGNGTYNHAWSGGPLTIMSQYIAGVTPTKPAFESYQVLPQLGNLNQVAAKIPSRYGVIELEINRDKSSPFKLRLKSPEKTTAAVGVPTLYVPRHGSITVNKTVVWQDGNKLETDLPVNLVNQDDRYLRFDVPAGAWIFEVTQSPKESDSNGLTAKERKLGFRSLFNGRDLKNWRHAGNWAVDKEAIYRQASGGGISLIDQQFPEDFELRFEWKVSKGANSGVYYRPGQYEYQILDNQHHADGKNPRTSAASLYFCMAPSHDATRQVGEWNTARIICQDTVIQHWLNDVKVIDFDYTDPQWASHVELLRKRRGDLKDRGGHLQLQDHGDPVWFRNIKLRELQPNESLERTSVTPEKIPAAALEHEQHILELINHRSP